MEQKEQQQVERTGAQDRVKRFLKRTAFIFVLLFVISAGFNAVPLSIRELNNAFFSLFVHDDRVATSTPSTLVVPQTYVEPVRISAPKVGLDVTILNPESRDSKVLDDALLYGAVRYPGSGDLGGTQNIFIFGHSSFLPVVHNQNFKAFNGLKDLKVGDEVTLYSTTESFLYTVEKVEHTMADLAYINVALHEHKLILATCDSFGAKEERYIVTASYKGKAALK